MPELDIPMRQLVRIPHFPPPEPPTRDVPQRLLSTVPEGTAFRDHHPDLQFSPEKPKYCTTKTICVLIALIVLPCVFLITRYYSKTRSSNAYIEEHTIEVWNKSVLIDHCAAGYTWFQETNHCYKATPVPVSFDAAKAACQADGAHLTSIHSVSEAVFVSGLYHTTHRQHNQNHILTTKYFFWIGLTRSGTARKWLDGSQMDFENWLTEKFDRNTTKQWVAVGPSSILWFWTTLTEGGFVCKKPGIGAVAEAPKLNVKCPRNYRWFQLTSSCYLVSTKEVGFEDAHKACATDKSNLVSVHSELENIYLNGLIMLALEANSKQDAKLAFWIGLTIKDGQYSWTDRSPLNFFDWHPAEHNYVPGKHRFVWTFWSSWKPEQQNSNGFICKRDGT